MRHPVLMALCLSGMVGLAACQPSADAASKRALASITEADAESLNEIMLTAGDPAEAVAYFTRASAERPDDPALKRGLAKSLIRANRPSEAVRILTTLTASPTATNEDRIALAEALIRTNDWAGAKAQLNQVPPTVETYDRYRLEAMVADSDKNWKKADSFYEIASSLTTKPAGVLNNWGFSKLNRQDYAGAERLFTEALTFDPTLFTAKNNLILARGAQRKYDLPIITMTQTERAELLYTLALTAIKLGDVTVGKGLLQDAIETHPQYFEAAERSLQALGG